MMVTDPKDPFRTGFLRVIDPARVTAVIDLKEATVFDDPEEAGKLVNNSGLWRHLGSYAMVEEFQID